MNNSLIKYLNSYQKDQSFVLMTDYLRIFSEESQLKVVESLSFLNEVHEYFF